MRDIAVLGLALKKAQKTHPHNPEPQNIADVNTAFAKIESSGYDFARKNTQGCKENNYRTFSKIEIKSVFLARLSINIIVM